MRHETHTIQRNESFSTFLWAELFHWEFVVLQDDSNGPAELVSVSGQVFCLFL